MRTSLLAWRNIFWIGLAVVLLHSAAPAQIQSAKPWPTKEEIFKQACVKLRFCRGPEEVKSVEFGMIGQREIALANFKQFYPQPSGPWLRLDEGYHLFEWTSDGKWNHFTGRAFLNPTLPLSASTLKEEFPSGWGNLIVLLSLGPTYFDFVLEKAEMEVLEGEKTLQISVTGPRRPSEEAVPPLQS